MPKQEIVGYLMDKPSGIMSERSAMKVACCVLGGERASDRPDLLDLRRYFYLLLFHLIGVGVISIDSLDCDKRESDNNRYLYSRSHIHK